MPERKGHDALFEHLRQLVGHLRSPPLTRAQHFKPVPVDLSLPRIERGAMHAKRSARVRDARPRREREQLQAIAEQHVILRHAARPPSLGGEGTTMSRSPDGPDTIGASGASDTHLQQSDLSGELGVRPT
jgi:hypothetical protein